MVGPCATPETPNMRYAPSWICVRKGFDGRRNLENSAMRRNLTFYMFIKFLFLEFDDKDDGTCCF
jgi:hypothetical protein